MRTEVKAGLVVGLIIIGGVVFYAVNRNKPGEADIPFDVKTDDAQEAARADHTTNQEWPTRTVDRSTTDRPARQPESDVPGPAATPPSGGAHSDLSSADLLASLSPSAADRGPVATPLTTQPAEEPVATPTSQPSLPPMDTRPLSTPLPSHVEKPVETRDRSTRVREAPKPKPAPVRYTIEKGDNFYSIARDHYGDAHYWKLIRDANPEANPERLQVGQILLLPPKEDMLKQLEREAAGSRSSTTRKPPITSVALTYVVGAGDTLTSIARNVLGDGSRWREIYELNRDKLDNPDLLFEGLELRMPEKK